MKNEKQGINCIGCRYFIIFRSITFVYQLGMRSGTNQASETSEPVEKAEKNSRDLTICQS